MSIICQTFVQNAWRSDLCSNCFKSFDDHSDTGGRNACERLSTPRYVPQATSLYQSRGISTSMKWRLSDSLYDRVSRRDFGSQTLNKVNQEEPENTSKGILIKSSSSEKKLRSRPSVDFASEEALVIGYGGNDYDSDNSPWEMGSDDGSVDLALLDDTDEDRKITKMTRNNTEFNSSNKNLLSDNDSSRNFKKEEEKLNCINNNISTPHKTTDKALNILTYNDIQSQKTEKRLNQYYFSSTDPLKSYLHSNNRNSLIIEEALPKNNKDRFQDNSKIENSKREVTNKGSDNCRISLSDNFTPLNTRTYSFVSELNKNNTSFEQSSDSDYSTCRLTAGDSTDSESFQDAEESRILPCQSFLHGNYPLGLSHSQINDLDRDKKYDAGSSTSGDVSNFSDDSDVHEQTDKSSYKPRNVRSPKTSLTVDSKKGVKEANPKTISNTKTEKESTVENKNTRLKINVQDASHSPVKTDKSDAPPITKDLSSVNIPVNSPIRTSNEDNSQVEGNKIKRNSRVEDVVSVRVQSQYSNGIQKSIKIKQPAPTVDTVSIVEANNVSNIIAIGGCRASAEKEANPNVSLIRKRSSLLSKTEAANEHQCADSSEPLAELQNNLNGNNAVDGCEITGKFPKSQEVASPALSETGQPDFDEGIDYDKSPDAIIDRQSKLAALALELELARRDLASNSCNSALSPDPPPPPPEVKAKCVPHSVPTTPCTPSDNYPTIKKSGAISCASRLSSLPDVLQETPTKTKKNKFSLKKLLKRNKESGTFTPTSKEMNPKAWKKQTFDRSRLSLEIVHPMDIASDPATSADTTPTEENKYIVSRNPGRGVFKGVSSRARSLSALPQLCSDFQDPSGIALLDCRKMDTVPARKAGTVAERKKNRPSLVRTPSCSALPNRPAINSPPQNSERVPPPKPPPPPKCKVMHPSPPPPPPHHPRISKPSCSPARPPPPKIPETKPRSHTISSAPKELHDQMKSDKEYANLGDIRSLLTPKKPQRPSAFSVPRDNETEIKKSADEIYETLQAAEEEEDHYTYLDESEQMKTLKGAGSASNASESRFKTAESATPCERPWLDLQTSYAAIAAANYESLAELITTSLNEGTEYLQNPGRSLKWKDFSIESEEPYQISRDRKVFDGVFKIQGQDKVTLMVASRKQMASQNSRNQTRYPVLASFSDHIPKSFASADYSPTAQDAEMTSIYVLQRSRVTTVSQFAKNTSSDKSNQHIHLRNYCFVLLQLIHTLKSLQAEGIEEINCDLQRLFLVATHEEKPPILVLFPEEKIYLTLCDSVRSRKTLCQATLETMFHFLQIASASDLVSCVVNGELLAGPVAHTFKAIAKVLQEEKASSLSQAKGLLEYMLWGPVDVKTNQCDGVVDTVLQRWLDLQRAQMVKSTISHLQLKKNSFTMLHVYEEYQLIFLLQASVKSLKNVISKL